MDIGQPDPFRLFDSDDEGILGLVAGQTQPNAAEAHATARDWKPRMSQESLELEHSLRKAVEEAKAELVEKNHELRRARNALQRELASRTEDLAQLTQELIDSRKNLISTKDELAAELVAMNRLHELSTALLGQTELQPLLEEVLNATIALQNADMGCVQLYNPEHSGA